MSACCRFVLVFIFVAVAQLTLAAEGPREGKEYILIESVAPDKASKISVIEFFSYQCPHCFAFAKPLLEWSKSLPADVQLERKAISIGHQSWVDIARTYYALQEMGNLDSLDAAIFTAIHQQKVPLEQFDAAYRSAKVREVLTAGEQQAVRYKIPGVPTIVIDGKYMVGIASNVPFDQQLAIVDSVIALARADRTK